MEWESWWQRQFVVKKFQYFLILRILKIRAAQVNSCVCVVVSEYKVVRPQFWQVALEIQCELFLLLLTACVCVSECKKHEHLCVSV